MTAPRRQLFISRTGAHIAAERMAREAGASAEHAAKYTRAYHVTGGWEAWYRPPSTSAYRPVLEGDLK